ncbi:hypothetical protein Pmani_032348 [Petrolisthes manimaculis]|uniref:CCZ1/INTU/HSP4 first Longin domain-containing protein n=1 Tax=Petrolisthes manimaculis TaxID=1843537 RepID=A0AAE1NRW0_9EUCA|nr:hypothetical protein Pmani_032348 [Petrolisthes manimaculis]
MATQTSSEPKLVNIFIFNANYGQKEGHEHEKILYYHPSSADLDTQVRQVGLAEAITRFSSTFKKDGDCEAVHTQKTRQVFYQVEPDVWMVMTVAVGWVWRERDGGIGVREYQGEAVQDTVLRARLLAAYTALSLTHHSMESLLNTKGVQGLRAALTTFMNSYLASVEMWGGDILAVWGGVSFVPLDRQTFLRVHCCLSLLQSSVPTIAHTAFFYAHQVVWCGLCLEDLRALSHYLNTQLLPSHVHTSHSSSSSSSSSSSTPCSYLSRFVGEGVTPGTRVYVRGEEGGELTPHHLLVYILAGATVCITLAETEVLTPHLFEKIDRLLESKVSQLASDIGEQLGKKFNSTDGGLAGGGGAGGGGGTGGGGSSNFRYVYHNHMNLATKTTLHGVHGVPVEVMRSITNLYTDMRKCGSGEGVVKPGEDHWVVGRRGDGREFYVVVSHKNANLVQVTDEVNRMCASHFSNIFLIE